MIIDLTEEKTLSETADLCGGKAYGSGRVNSISIDSREVSENTLFIAVKGENTDGHKYIGKAIENGCTSVICEKFPEECNASYILVNDTTEALCHIASSSLRKYNPFTVGVTGSVGKTTTKEFIYAVLSEKYKTLKSGGNFNTIYGLALTAASISKEIKAAVFEMGMCRFGEISQMTKCANINAGVITNIGTAHLEALGTRENIAKAKLEITEGIRKNGVLIYNSDEPLLVDNLPENIRCIGFGIQNEQSEIFAYGIRTDIEKTTFNMRYFDKEITDIVIPCTGKHNVFNSMAAYAVGSEAGLTEKEIRQGLLKYKTTGMRQNIKQFNGITFIEDCYNASPESMKASLSVLAEIGKDKRKIAVLGDMRELGSNSEELHKSVGAEAVDLKTDIIVTYGKNALAIADGAKKAGMNKDDVFSFDDIDNTEYITNKLKEIIKKDDVILFKASRAVGLERVIKRLM